MRRERPSIAGSILTSLGEDLSLQSARAVLRGALQRARLSSVQLERRGLDASLLDPLRDSLRANVRDLVVRNRCEQRLAALVAGRSPDEIAPINIEIETEFDIVTARNCARNLAGDLGLEIAARTQIATAVSELARNMYRYAGGGRICLSPLSEPKRGVEILAADSGPGIAQLELVLSGDYESSTGMGLGLIACRRLMDTFDIQTGPEGTTIRAAKFR